MKDIKSILVPIDFSDAANNALRYAIWLASNLKAKVRLLHVIYPELEPADMPVMSGRLTITKAETSKDLMKGLVENYLAGIGKEKRPDIETEVEVGVPGTLVAQIAGKHRVDLIVMGTKGKHNLLDKTIGNVTLSTMDISHCPVLVIPEKIDILRIETVAYSTDLVASDPFHIWKVGKLLAPMSPILRVVHIKRKIEEEKAMKMDELKQFFKGNPPSLQVTFHNVLNKNVTEELEDFIKDWDVDLLVMNRPNRTIIERIFHSSLTRKTALQTKIPFLVLK
ncbi:MAG: nucleotide-binding universal stress UspA family protein [Saprospiraceae bacterium]|jgi:nucleotide-binding universal stress UspA family protein